MKLAGEIAKKSLPEPCDGKVVEYIAVLGGHRKIEPTLSTELQCFACEGKAHFAPWFNDDARVWICANSVCVTVQLKNISKATHTPPKQFRELLWPQFCEMNGIGDMHYGVKFEDVKQADGKISFLLKFAVKPSGIIFMQGDKGTGKTFASMGVCELFTRKNTSCIFTTHKQMVDRWLQAAKSPVYDNYAERIGMPKLLVIDDFGTTESSPKFMEFFMDLINTRIQWTDRGTIITTNLSDEKFSEFCGSALSDRIMTGQKFVFKGKSRRESKPL